MARRRPGSLLAKAGLLRDFPVKVETRLSRYWILPSLFEFNRATAGPKPQAEFTTVA